MEIIDVCACAQVHGKWAEDEEVREEERIETAKKLIAENIPLETIAKCTSLSVEEIKTLSNL